MRKMVKAAGYVMAHLQSQHSTPLGVSVQDMLIWFSVAVLFLLVIGTLPW